MYLPKCDFVTISLQALCPASDPLMAMVSIPHIELMDLRCRTPGKTVIAVTGHSGKAFCKHAIPAYNGMEIQDLAKATTASLNRETAALTV